MASKRVPLGHHLVKKVWSEEVGVMVYRHWSSKPFCASSQGTLVACWYRTAYCRTILRATDWTDVANSAGRRGWGWVRIPLGLKNTQTRINFTRFPCCYRIWTRVSLTGGRGANRILPHWLAIVYCFKLSFCQNARPMGQSFLQKYTMNLLKGPKDPILHTLVSIYSEKKNIFLFFSLPIPKGQENGCQASIFVSILRKTSKVIKLLAHPNSRSLCQS